MKVKSIASIDTALRIYYTYPEIGNKQIKELFAPIGDATISRFKKAVQEAQAEKDVKTSQMKTVNTAVAYEVWGIDIDDLERRRDKLKKLGLNT